MIDFIDDPLEMEIQDYMKALDITNEDRLLSLEYNKYICLMKWTKLTN